MNVTFACPHCDQTAHAPLVADASSIDCLHCHATLATPPEAWAGQELARCLVCGSRDLFIRKDFPHRLGLAIVVSGFAISCVTWYFYWTYLTFAVLFATALVDMMLFFIVGDSLTCYRCQAEYRHLPIMTEHGPFSLETHERYRQQAARLARSVPAAASAARETPVTHDTPAG
jgi:DNA-directed RNA polymerase subunit RPC12/RpoP